jgi:hypothetical protein
MEKARKVCHGKRCTFWPGDFYLESAGGEILGRVAQAMLVRLGKTQERGCLDMKRQSPISVMSLVATYPTGDVESLTSLINLSNSCDVKVFNVRAKASIFAILVFKWGSSWIDTLIVSVPLRARRETIWVGKRVHKPSPTGNGISVRL